MPLFSLPDRGRQGACPLFFRRCMVVGGRGRVLCFFRRCMVVGGRGRFRRPPHPLRPARCRCRVRVGAGLGCGRPVRGERAACRAETLLRDDNWPIGCLRDGWYGERRALTSRFLSPDPLSCLRSGNTIALADLTSFYHEEEFDQCETKKIPARNTGMHETGVGLLQRQT